MADQEYEIGYKKPPVTSQFQHGKSGNPKGRKKGLKNLKTDFLEEIGERVTLTEGGKKIRITKQRALVKTLVVKGIKGDQRAIAKAFDLLIRFFGIDEQAEDNAPLPAEDQAILDDFINRRAGDAKS